MIQTNVRVLSKLTTPTISIRNTVLFQSIVLGFSVFPKRCVCVCFSQISRRTNLTTRNLIAINGTDVHTAENIFLRIEIPTNFMSLSENKYIISERHDLIKYTFIVRDKKNMTVYRSN